MIELATAAAAVGFVAATAWALAVDARETRRHRPGIAARPTRRSAHRPPSYDAHVRYHTALLDRYGPGIRRRLLDGRTVDPETGEILS